LGRKHIYLPHAQTAIYHSKVKLFLKQGISRQLSKFECENSAIDVIINFFMKNIPQADLRRVKVPGTGPL
jgi:hypothetical protein